MSIGSIAGSLLGGNPFLLMLGHMLQPGTDWKAVLKDEGTAAAKVKIQALWHEQVSEKDRQHTAEKMEGEGWSWAAAGDPAFLAEQKVEISDADRAKYGDRVNGFIIARDAVYSFFRDTGVPGGAIRDGWRDTVDNAVWEAMEAKETKVGPSTPLLDIVNGAFEELVRVVL